MFRADRDVVETNVKLEGRDHGSVTPKVSAALRKMAKTFSWQPGNLIKKGYYSELSEEPYCGDSLKLDIDFSFRYRGEIDSSLSREAISEAMRRIMDYRHKHCYSAGAYFVPKTSWDDEEDYDLLFLNFHIYISNSPTKFYVVNRDDKECAAGAFGKIHFLSGVVKPAHGVVGAMEYFPYPPSKQVVVKAQQVSGDETAYEFVCNVQREAKCQRVLGDVKVKSSTLFSIDARDQSFQLSHDNCEYYKSQGYRETHALITMPFVFGWTLDQLYVLGTDDANLQHHMEVTEKQELEERNNARKEGRTFSQEQNEEDKILAAKICALEFLRTPEGRFIVTRHLILKFKQMRLNGIVHGDVKPQNIMLEFSIETGSIFIKYLDFGSSYQAPSDPKKISGSPRYLAPELMLSIKKMACYTTDFTTDEYSLALVLMHVWGDRALALPNMTEYQYYAMRLKEESVQHDLFHGVALPENIKTNIRTLFTNWTLLDYVKRTKINEVLTTFEIARFDYFKSRLEDKPEVKAKLEDSHKLALCNSRLQFFTTNVATHLAYAKALCEQLKGMVARLSDEPEAIRLFAQTMGIAAITCLTHKDEFKRVIDECYQAYESSYALCQAESEKFKPLPQMKEVIDAAKNSEYTAYRNHATLFMQKRRDKRCEFDELRVEAKRMERKTEKFKKAGAYFGMK